MQYKLIICGGTFDHLHAGHKAFLQYAFSLGEHVVIGLTSDQYVGIYKKDTKVQSFSERKDELEVFLRSIHVYERGGIVKIDSRFDQTQIPHTDAALLVSSETKQQGEEINSEREKKGLTPFPLLIFPLVTTSQGEKISSSSIREGVMDKNGMMLPDKRFISKTLFLPDDLRTLLHEPFGILFSKDIPKQFLKDPSKLITVGDVTTKRLTHLGVMPKIAVIDFFVERKRTHETLEQLGFVGNERVVHIVNPAGQVAKGVWKKLIPTVHAISSNTHSIIVVEGEEDLLVIPLILILPIGFYVCYGQPRLWRGERVSSSDDSTLPIDKPREGIVILEITQALKQQTYRLIKQFVH